MNRLLVLSLLITGVMSGLVRVPKIYNALISSDGNLSPSQAYPIIEPIYRTTALGVAFPPIIVQPQVHPQPTRQEVKPTQEEKNGEFLQSKRTEMPQIAYHGSLYPLAYDPYLSYGNHHDFLYPALPYYQHPVFIDLDKNNIKVEKETIQPIQKPVINFKKNPEIPDVLPPPPIKDERKGKS